MNQIKTQETIDSVVISDLSELNAMLGSQFENPQLSPLAASQVKEQLSAHVRATEAILLPEIQELEDSPVFSGMIVQDQNTLRQDLSVLESFDATTSIGAEALNRVREEFEDYQNRAINGWLPFLNKNLSSEQSLQLGESYRKVQYASLPIDATRSDDISSFSSITPLPLDEDMRMVVDQYSNMATSDWDGLSVEQVRSLPSFADAVTKVMKLKNVVLADSVKEEKISLPFENNILKGTVFTPARLGADVPLVVYAHGGGWVTSSPEGYGISARLLAHNLMAPVISLDYPLAPESPFPAAHDYVSACVRFLAESVGSSWGTNGRVALIGESAGANMILSAAVDLMELGGRCDFVCLVYPVTSTSENWESFDTYAEAIPLSASKMRWFTSHLFAGKDANAQINLHDIPAGLLANLPATFVISASHDPLCSEGEAFGELLSECGVDVLTARYEGVPHEFLSAAPVCVKSHTALMDISDAFNVARAGGSLGGGSHRIIS